MLIQDLLAFFALGFLGQAVYIGIVRRQLKRMTKERDSWKLAAAHWEEEAHR